MSLRSSSLSLLAPFLASPALAAAVPQSPDRLDPVVVTAPALTEPLTVRLDPQAPVQPLPAQDGADFLKAIPGFNVIRKGGADGDPVFRGMGGSRLGILADGQNVLGGCGMRMDPPTAYIFPASFDSVVIRKGPQSVLQGPGASAGVVSFERSDERGASPSQHARASATLGSFGRNDQALDTAVYRKYGYAEVSGNRSASDDYEDGSGRLVHSSHERWSALAAAGWTPDEMTLVEVSFGLSDGEAAYADRAMDGVKFDRTTFALRAERSFETGVLRSLTARAYHAYIDHVMDNYTLRTFTPTMMMPGRSVSNPDRRTLGARVSAVLEGEALGHLEVGGDAQANRHRVRSTMNETMMPYEARSRVKDATFAQLGAFGEWSHALPADGRVVAGARLDAWEAEKPVAGLSRDETLPSGFARYEWERGAWTAYAGVGHAERFPDYWELVGGQPAKPNAAFLTEPELTTQFDTGLAFRRGAVEASVSLFAADIRDFILIQPTSATITRNVDARTLGGEAAARWSFAPGWRGEVSAAYVRGENRTDARPLAQMPPLEGRVGLSYAARAWTVGGLLRLVSEQDRFAAGQGGIVGQDLGPSDGFAVVSLNAAFRLNSHLSVSVGADNLLDADYAEHISRGGAAVAGFLPTTRVQEPGRLLWVRAEVSY